MVIALAVILPLIALGLVVKCVRSRKAKAVKMPKAPKEVSSLLLEDEME